MRWPSFTLTVEIIRSLMAAEVDQHGAVWVAAYSVPDHFTVASNRASGRWSKLNRVGLKVRSQVLEASAE